MATDRVFGLVVVLIAVAYVATALQIETSFLADPVGPKAFPIGIGTVAAICGLVMMVRPDPSPHWPALKTLGALLVAVCAMVAYAFALKPLAFLIPTALTATILSYQITPRVLPAIAVGIGMSLGLFVLFKYGLNLGLFAFPKGWFS